ncbi:hypothetical protein STSP2_01836 [Anaerohalosphaera lusitana]|uniref:Roadblock/LC7 domain protein n=1 Tax=Anaerohalosphaera lusitana TaxID=1936003 RepID=A0A1U9NLI7_9BACT|nr:hypothetical protein [Anaerohalosphaera lusitana]AQT68667.1 hypothetical protein STSP2_01836 [Anaerohalosphaera lusitana]
MDVFSSLFSFSPMVVEQLMGELKESLPEDGLFVVIRDEDGNWWSSEESESGAVSEFGGELELLCGRIADGYDPVVCELGDKIAAGRQLEGEEITCGYVFVMVDRDQVGSAEGVNSLIEMVLNQICMGVRLIEKNNRLHHDRLKQMSGGKAVGA